MRKEKDLIENKVKYALEEELVRRVNQAVSNLGGIKSIKKELKQDGKRMNFTSGIKDKLLNLMKSHDDDNKEITEDEKKKLEIERKIKVKLLGHIEITMENAEKKGPDHSVPSLFELMDNDEFSLTRSVIPPDKPNRVLNKMHQGFSEAEQFKVE